MKGRKGHAFVAELETPKPLLGVNAFETFKVTRRVIVVSKENG